MASLSNSALQPLTDNAMNTSLEMESNKKMTVLPNEREELGGSNMEEEHKTVVEHEDNGVFLTWKDLSVRVSKGKRGTKSILQDLTGYARPGQLLAIMGPSGSGKSTLLDALAGNLLIIYIYIICLLD